MVAVDRVKQGFNLQVALFVLQVVLAAFGWWIRTELTEIRTHETKVHEDQENRIRVLETFAAAGNRWTQEDQYIYESRVSRDLEAIRLDLALIKRELGIPIPSNNGKPR